MREQAENENKDRGNPKHRQQRPGDEMRILVLRPGSGADGKHGADDLPGGEIHQASDQGYGSVESGKLGSEEVLYQQNVDVVDDDLADEENDGLHAFAERRRMTGLALYLEFAPEGRAEVGGEDGGGDRAHRAEHAITDRHQQHSGKEAGDSFNNEAGTEPAEGTQPLHGAATHAEGHIDRDANGENRGNVAVRQVQVGGHRTLRCKQSAAHQQADQPGLAAQRAVNRGLGSGTVVTRDEFRENQMKGQSDGRGQYEQGDHGRDMPEHGRAKQARHNHVVDKVKNT